MKTSYRKFFISLVFFCLFVLGIAVHNDYGLPWDNTISRTNGVYAFRYMFGDTEMDSYRDKYYSTGFELPLVLIEHALNITSKQHIFYMRFLVSYLLFFCSLIAFYLYIQQVCKKWWLGIVGVGAMVLYPRIFVDSFTNSKDVGLLSMVIVTITTFTQFSRKKNMLWAGIHGIILGLTIAVRPVAIMFIPLFFMTLFLNRRKKSVQNISMFLIYSIGLSIGTLIFWPYLWPDPIRRFITAVSLFSQFPFEGTVLYLGQYIKAGETPWHYLPVWMGVTIPPVVLGFFIIGTVRNSLNRKDVFDTSVMMYWLFVPMISIILFRSVVYDGWRHVYFVFPAIVIIGLRGLEWIWDIQRYRKVLRVVVCCLVIGQAGELVWWDVRTHPHEHVYFNIFAGGMNRAKEQFDLDYWALSYRRCLEDILTKDKRSSIRIFFHTSQIDVSYILPPEDQSRIIEVKDPTQAQYFFSNYRGHKEEYPSKSVPACTVEIDDTRIAIVYRIQP